MDPSVLCGRSDIRRAIAERLGDVEIRVREEAVEVTGQSLLAQPAPALNLSGNDDGDSASPPSTDTATNVANNDENIDLLPPDVEEADNFTEVKVDEYISPLLTLLSDKGASVKRAAVHVLRDILLVHLCIRATLKSA